jgi:hypothetical protein
MKNLSTLAEIAIDNPHVEPIRLIEITIGSTTLYLCDRVFNDGFCTFDGQLYEPFVISWGTIKIGQLDPVTYETDPGEASLVVDNSRPVGGAARFTALFAGTAPQYSAVSIYEIYSDDATGADKIDLFAGKIEDLPEMTADRATIICSGFELDVVNRFSHTIVDSTNYPGADPDALGKMIPQVYGTAKRVPCIAADAGGKTTIAQDMTDTSPGNGGTLEVSDAATLPATGGFTIQIDSEQIQIYSRSGNVLTLAASGARGYNSTTAVPHDQGAPLAEIQTQYVYLLADHPVDSINAVYVDNIRQTTGFTAYTGQTGDECSGYLGQAVIVFDAVPAYQRQVNLALDDQIDVDDTIDIGAEQTWSPQEPGHAHDVSAYYSADVTWHPTSASVQNGATAPSGLGNTYDNNVGTSNLLTHSNMSGATASAAWSFPAASITDHIPYQFRVGVNLRQYSGYSVSFQIWSSLGGSYFGTVPSSSTTYYTGWTSASGLTWAQVYGAGFYLSLYGSNAAYGSLINEFWIEVKGQVAGSGITTQSSQAGVSLNASGNTELTGAVTKTGTVYLTGNSTAETVIGERVAADLDGYIDIDGSITGTIGLLIERPDHIARHILVDRCGLSSSEIDAAAYLDAGSFFDEKGFVLGFPILQRPNVRNLLNRIAHQGRALEFWDAGKHHIVPIPDSDVLDKSLDGARVDLGQIWLSYTDRVQIKNTLTARYDRHWSGAQTEEEADQATVTATDTASVATFGTLQGDPLSFPYVQNSAQAQALLDWTLDDAKGPRLMVEFSGGYSLADVQTGDVIGFRVETDADLEQAFLGLITADLSGFRVLEKDYRSDGAIQITCISIGIVSVSVIADDLDFSFSIGNLDLIYPKMTFNFSVDGNLHLTQKHQIQAAGMDFTFTISNIDFASAVFYLLLESGDFMLTESGDKIVLEKPDFILLENGNDHLLLENGDRLLTEI